MKEIEIRKAKIDDLETISIIEATCFPKAEAAPKEVIEKRLKVFENSFFVAEDNGKVIGFINGCVTDMSTLVDELYHDITLHKENGLYQTVFGLDVLHEYQHKGIASKLMNYFIKNSKERGKIGISLTCKDYLIGFYQNFGYVHQGVSGSTHGGVKWNDMFLSL